MGSRGVIGRHRILDTDVFFAGVHDNRIFE
jgi:hypothetical protein